jgi:tetratricopeptide (TPR) repeat protein
MQDNGSSDWQEAKSLYEAGKFDEALQAFQTHPNDTAQYFHNLGTVYYRVGQPGRALAYLEKANSLKPHDPETQHNLHLAQAAVGQLIGEARLDAASTGLESLADRVSLQEVRGALGLLGLLVAVLWLRAYWKTRNLKRTFLQPAGFIGLLGFGLTAGLYFTERLAQSHPPAFAVERQVIRSGPGDQFAQLGQVEPGMKIRLLGPVDQDWRQVRYSTDGIGWIKASSLLLL